MPPVDVFTIKRFRAGENVERADGAYDPMTRVVSDGPILIGKIARTHLNEFRNYCTQWA